jgi:Fe-S cluster biogenesis protein NfuA
MAAIIGTDLRERVARALRDHVAPALHMDGGSIELLDVSDGIVQVRLLGAVCCPTTVMALVASLESELRSHVPEVEYVEVTS